MIPAYAPVMACVARLRPFATRERADLVVVAVLLGWGLADVPWPWRPPGHGGTAAAVCGFLALALVQSVPSLWRRRFPGTGLALACGALALRTVLHRHTVSGLTAVAATGYGFGTYSDLGRRYARPLLLGAALLAVTAAVSYQVRTAIGVPGVLLGAAFVAGDAATTRRHAAETMVEAARAAERGRIARELHDVLAHQLSAITMRAGAARVAAKSGDAASRDTAAAETLSTIEGLAREALIELGHLLSILRRDAEEAARRPAPCLAEVPSLVASARGAGTAAGLTLIGPPRPLSPGVELAAYRIVQEALTNVAKHAPGATAEVVLRFGPKALELSVVNDRAAPHRSVRPPATGGRGMLGMRERAELHGGSLTVTEPPEGGFAIQAELPYGPAGGTW